MPTGGHGGVDKSSRKRKVPVRSHERSVDAPEDPLRQLVVERMTKGLVGRVASELSAANYGPSEWWLLL